MSRIRLTTILTLVGLAAVAAALWFLILSPRMSEAGEINARTADMEVQNLTLMTRYNNAMDQVRRAPEAAAEAQKLFAQMPQTAELPAVLDQITAAAVDAGIDESGVSNLSTGIPEPVQAGEGGVSGVQIATMAIGVDASGSQEADLAFLDNLQSLERALLVNQTSTSLQVAEEKKGLPDSDLRVGGSMFVLQSQLPDLVAKVDQVITKALGNDGATPTAE